MPATYPAHVLVHWESCLLGLEIPATEPARADSDIRAEQQLRFHSDVTPGPSHVRPGVAWVLWRPVESKAARLLLGPPRPRCVQLELALTTKRPM